MAYAALRGAFFTFPVRVFAQLNAECCSKIKVANCDHLPRGMVLNPATPSPLFWQDGFPYWAVSPTKIPSIGWGFLYEKLREPSFMLRYQRLIFLGLV